MEGYYIGAAIVETGKNWDNHHIEVLKTAQELGKIGILGIS